MLKHLFIIIMMIKLFRYFTTVNSFSLWVNCEVCSKYDFPLIFEDSDDYSYELMSVDINQDSTLMALGGARTNSGTKQPLLAMYNLVDGTIKWAKTILHSNYAHSTVFGPES